MSGTNNLNVGNLVDNPNFDFVKILSQNNVTDNDDGTFSFLRSDEIDSPYSNNIINCSYVDHLDICRSNLNSKVNILSLNVQSLQAKFSELKDLIEHCSNNNFLPEIILLQEIWQIVDPNIFSLNQYQPLIFKCRTSNQGGGWESMSKRG
jgi:hypothetical protein